MVKKNFDFFTTLVEKMGNRLRVVILATYLYNVDEFSSAWYGQERLNSVVADRHEGTLQLQLISGAASLRLTRLKKSVEESTYFSAIPANAVLF